jgi:HEAT repeat protein
LIGELQDEETAVRRAAAQSLADMGLEAAPAASVLSSAIVDQDREVRRLALHAIGQVGPSAEPYLPVIKKAFGDGEISVRIAAAIAINRLDPNDLDHQRVLIDAMKSGEGGIIVRVGQMSPNAAWAVPTMIELLNDRRPGIRRITANALEQIGSAGVAAKPSLKRLALSDPDERVREAAERALVGLNSSGSPAGETSPTPAVE